MDRFGSDFGSFGSEDDGAYDAFDDTVHSNPPPSPVGQDERRMQVRAYNHWVADLGDQDLPHIEALEPENIEDFGPHSVLFDFSTGSGTPTIQFIGAKLQAECRAADAIEDLSEIPPGSLLAKVADNYLKVIAGQAPVTFEAESINAQGRTVAYRGVLLPYSSDLDTIDFVYAVVNWKEVADAATAEALLSEIDAAMDAQGPSADVIPFAPVAEAEAAPVVDDTPEAPPAWASSSVLGFTDQADTETTHTDLPVPTFGTADEEPPVTYYTPADDGDTPKRDRNVDALGNPIGGAPAKEEQAAPTPSSIAAEYGLPEWDEEEDIADDVDDLVNPLADIDLNSRLLSLVNAGARSKKTVDLATLSDSMGKADEEEDERPLFKPKAPPVDTLLTPEAYDEDEDEQAGEEEVAFETEAETEAEVEAEPEGFYEYTPPVFDIEAIDDEPIVEEEVDPVGFAHEPDIEETVETEPEAVFEIPSLAAVETVVEDEEPSDEAEIFELDDSAVFDDDEEPVELVLEASDIVEDVQDEPEPVGLIATSLEIVEMSEEKSDKDEDEDVFELAEFASFDDDAAVEEEVGAAPEPGDRRERCRTGAPAARNAPRPAGRSERTGRGGEHHAGSGPPRAV